MSKNYNSDSLIHIKDESGIEYLKFKILEKYNNKITHAITLRHGGISNAPYDSLNFRKNNEAEKENVEKNLKIISKTLNLEFNTVCKANQEHTTNILVLNNENKEKYLFNKENNEPFDAYILEDNNISTYITTADCIPIIIYDPANNVISNIHSGWRGTVNKIYMKAIDIFEKNYNSKMSDLIFCIGPHIKECCFSSEEEEFKEKFTNVWRDEKDYIYYEENRKRFHINMEKIIVGDILKRGILKENITTCDICTCCNSDDFFSCRASKKAGTDFGTFATFVGK